MTPTSKSDGKRTTMRAVGMLVCALSIVTTLAGVARSGDSKGCDDSKRCVPNKNCSFAVFNVTNVTDVPSGGAFCLNPSDKKGLKAARKQCEDQGRACCAEGELEACPTAKCDNRNNTVIQPRNTTNICSFVKCSRNQRAYFCKIEPEDDDD